jgi:hypothetical protein
VEAAHVEVEREVPADPTALQMVDVADDVAAVLVGTQDGHVDGSADVVDARCFPAALPELARVCAGPAAEVEGAAEGCFPLELLAVEHPHERRVGIGAGPVPSGQSEAVGEGVGGAHVISKIGSSDTGTNTL